MSLPGPPFFLGTTTVRGVVENKKTKSKAAKCAGERCCRAMGFKVKGGAHKRRSLKGRCVCFFFACASFLCVTPSSARREFDRRLFPGVCLIEMCVKGWRTQGAGRCRNWAAPRKTKGFKRWGSAGARPPRVTVFKDEVATSIVSASALGKEPRGRPMGGGRG